MRALRVRFCFWAVPRAAGGGGGAHEVDAVEAQVRVLLALRGPSRGRVTATGSAGVKHQAAAQADGLPLFVLGDTGRRAAARAGEVALHRLS